MNSAGEKTDDTISRVTAREVEVQAISRSAQRTTQDLGGHEDSPGMWRIPCDNEDEVVAALERLRDGGFRPAPEARADVARLATSSLCRAYRDGAIETLAFGQGFNSLTYDLCAIEPLRDDYLQLFILIEEWEAAVGSERADAAERLLALARQIAA